MSVSGRGAIVEPATGARCTSECEWNFAEGSHVRVEAVPEVGSLDGQWGACSGAGACEFTAASRSRLTVTFDEKPFDECEGLTPSALEAPLEVVFPDRDDREYCDDIVVDDVGNVAVGFGGFGLHMTHVLSREGSEVGLFSGAEPVLPRSSGFVGLTWGTTNAQLYNIAAWTPEGEKTAVAALPGNESWIFPAVTGGIVVLSTDSWGCPAGPYGVSEMIVQRISDDGSVLSSVDIGGVGCLGGVALSDAQNNTFVASITGRTGKLGFPPDRLIGRWIAADGTPQTPWFDVGPQRGSDLAPLIGGGVAIGDGSEWYASLPSASAEVREAPDFLATVGRKAVTNIGSAGYAAFPMPTITLGTEATIDVFGPNGKHCGSVPLRTKAWKLSLGRDGTVASLRHDNEGDACVVSWWPRMFQAGISDR